MSVPNAAGVETAIDPGQGLPRPPSKAVTEDEAQAIADVFDPDGRLDCIQVYWVHGFRGMQPLLQPIKAGWLGYCD